MKRNNIISDWLNEYGDPEIDKFVESKLNKNKMKATLEFFLPEDQADFDLAIQGGNMYCALWDISQELRTLYKYEELDEKEWAMVERIRDKFYEILNDHQISLNK